MVSDFITMVKGYLSLTTINGLLDIIVNMGQGGLILFHLNLGRHLGFQNQLTLILMYE